MRLQKSYAVLAGLMLAAAPLQANTIVRFTTPLYGLGVQEQLVLRVVDVKGLEFSPANVQVSFVEEGGHVVQTSTDPLPPGDAVTFRLPYAALGGTQSFPGVRMRISLDLPGIGNNNQVLLNYEFFNVETSQARPGGTCSQPAPPPLGGPEFKCFGPAIEFP